MNGNTYTRESLIQKQTNWKPKNELEPFWNSSYVISSELTERDWGGDMDVG